MAFLVDPTKTKRLEIPEHPGDWIEIRRLMAGDMDGISVLSSGMSLSRELLANVITAWSEPEPVTLDGVRKLELGMLPWLTREVIAFAGLRDDVEKKDSESSSSSTSSTEEARPGSSPT